MALTISKTQIPNTEPNVPSDGAGIQSRYVYDTVTGDYEYIENDSYSGSVSWAGCQFGASGTSVDGGPARPEGVTLVSAFCLEIHPFVCNPLARFPIDLNEIEHLYVDLSGGTIKRKERSVEFDEFGVATWTGPTTIDTDITASLTVLGLVASGTTCYPRLLGNVTNSGTVDAELLDIVDQAKIMRDNSRGNCVGFTWGMIPSVLSFDEVLAGTQGALAAMLGSNSMTINGGGYYEGTASCEWIEWSSGYGWSSAGIQLSAHSTLAPMSGPVPPRMD